MDKKVFRTRLFGYKKSDVNNYFQKASESFALTLAELNERKDAEAEVLRRNIDVANERIKELLEIKTEYERSKEMISETMCRAQQSAIEIEAEAEERAKQIALEAAKEVAKEQENLRRYRDEAMLLRREVASAIKRFGSDLSKV